MLYRVHELKSGIERFKSHRELNLFKQKTSFKTRLIKYALEVQSVYKTFSILCDLSLIFPKNLFHTKSVVKHQPISLLFTTISANQGTQPESLSLRTAKFSDYKKTKFCSKDGKLCNETQSHIQSA